MKLTRGLVPLWLCGLMSTMLCSCGPVYSPSPRSPSSTKSATSSSDTQYYSCRDSFDPCSCDIGRYRIDILEAQLSESNWSPARRDEVAANLSNVADFYKRDYWSYKRREDALRALRYYGAFLSIVPLSNENAPYAVLHSIAIYCHLGCQAKARDLVDELKSNYRYETSDLETALRYCG
jgi:hypothetical protein